jgi:hypothetical protein
MDDMTTFPNEELDDKIYMDQPDNFVVDGQEVNVCKLLKSLYGLKQAPKQCYENFDQTSLLKFGCVLIKQTKFWLEFDQTLTSTPSWWGPRSYALLVTY